MPTNKNFIRALLVWLLLGAAGAVSAQSSEPAVTQEQAVSKVREETGGTVLSAEPRRVGHRLEYRIKVLTPEGHVKVMAVSSEASKNPASSRSTKNPPARRAGSKEKH
jgi:hypothetical protein